MAFARAAFAPVIGSAGGVVAELGNGHDVQAMVELAIAGAGKPVADDVAGGRLDRSGAGVGGKRRSRAEPIDTAGSRSGRQYLPKWHQRHRFCGRVRWTTAAPGRPMICRGSNKLV
jgi:hypothetical protein